ncbi:MAG TPA: ABC transporter transmembrane domain-containing protein, partial [Steroidobacter sp.]|nr:ABC transporter transmembrane domain-containing protein [Steroidobacter sp.]
MVKSRVEGSQVLRNVLVFTVRHWAQRKWLVVFVAAAMMLATVTEVIVPVYAGRLVDALAQGREFAHVALDSFLVMMGLGLTMVVLRHLAWWSIVPLTLGMMRNVSQGAFHRVQRFSTDWHNNSFAGSIVRKITRGMWALDMINDVLLLALLPSLVVLVGTVFLLGQRWPIMGVVMALGSIAYVLLTVTLATRLIAPASRLSNAQDTRMGGVLADALGA